jgi:hypothetical protein
MAKRKSSKPLKRVVAKSGQVYYFKGGKRIATKKGEKLLKKEITQNKIPLPQNLTPKEELFLKRSQAAKKAAANTYKYQGRPIPRIYAVLMQKLFPKMDFLQTMDLSKWADPRTGKPIFPRFSDIQRNIDNASKTDSEIFKLLTEMGYFKDKKGRTALIDICEIIQQKEYDKFKFILIDDEGNEFRGRVKVCEMIREFEEFVTTDIRASLGMNVIKTYFDYSPNYDFKNKIFKLDLSDQNPKVSIDDIVNRGVDKNNTLTTTKGELIIPAKIIGDSGQPIDVEPKSSIGKNKFKKVYITFSVS